MTFELGPFGPINNHYTLIFACISALLRRCFQCRSRGELGSCKDPFTFNATDVEKESGVAAIPCASGWCGKVIEGGGTYAVDGKYAMFTGQPNILQ